MKLRQGARHLAARSILGLMICLPGIAAVSPAIAGATPFVVVADADTAAEIRAALYSSADAAADTRTSEVVAFYQGRNYQPAWSGSDAAVEQGRQVAFILSHAYQQGLRAEDYPVGAAGNAQNPAAADIIMTASLLRYAHDVRTGRLTPAQIYRDTDLVPWRFDAVGALSEAVRRDAVADFLVGLPPTHPGYAGLVKALAHYSQSRQNSARAQQIAANMERWRWLPPVMESRYVAVNVPDQSLQFVRDGQVLLQSKVIIGRPDAPTPILRTTVQAVVANPVWDIPDDIAARMLGHRDPSFLANKNIVFENGQYRQNPGPDNGLGLIMLDMPNPFWVYMHDTPSKNLFQSNMREHSNGCVRVQEIFPLASLALSDDTAAGMPQLQEAIATGTTQRLPLSSPLPVYLLYWTASADENGNVEFRPDRYGRDPVLMAALGFHPGPPAVAARPQSPSGKPTQRRHKKAPTAQAALHMPQSAAQ